MVMNNWGTPFHPSWLANNLTPALYSGNLAVDITFSLGTTLVTGGVHSLIYYVILIFTPPSYFVFVLSINSRYDICRGVYPDLPPPHQVAMALFPWGPPRGRVCLLHDIRW